MKEYRFGEIWVEIDEEATRDYYANSVVWDCTCGHCRNFVEVAKKRQLPEELLRLLDKLSIPPEKATYVCEMDAQGRRLFYELSYRLSGRVLKSPEKRAVTMEWGELWCDEQIAPGSAEAFPKPWFDLTLFLWLPWVLDEPVEEPR